MPKSQAEGFKNALTKVYDTMFPDGVLDSKINWSKIVNVPHFERLRDIMARSKGKILRGGQVDDQKRIALTLYTDVKLDDALMEEYGYAHCECCPSADAVKLPERFSGLCCRSSRLRTSTKRSRSSQTGECSIASAVR